MTWLRRILCALGWHGKAVSRTRPHRTLRAVHEHWEACPHCSAVLPDPPSRPRSAWFDL